jgi:hypothetical protein
MNETTSQTALITGSSSGIGLHLAREFVRHGHPLLADPADGGICLPLHLSPEGEVPVAEQLRKFITASEKEYPAEFLPETPPSALVLAALKHGSPLPSTLWRALLYRADEETTETASSA